jgi:hypothetical protein
MVQKLAEQPRTDNLKPSQHLIGLLCDSDPNSSPPIPSLAFVEISGQFF